MKGDPCWNVTSLDALLAAPLVTCERNAIIVYVNIYFRFRWIGSRDRQQMQPCFDELGWDLPAPITPTLNREWRKLQLNRLYFPAKLNVATSIMQNEYICVTSHMVQTSSGFA